MAPSPGDVVENPDFAVIGLGNPGERYAITRHNFGSRVLDALARDAGAEFRPAAGPCRICSFTADQVGGILAKPTTYMNHSGLAGRAILDRFHELRLSRFLVVTDDLDLPLGRVRFRGAGGNGGHNGLRSLIEELGSGEFPRLRLGIGRPGADGPGDVVDHVLDPFLSDEMEIVNEVVDRATAGVRVFIGEGIESAMNRFNAE